MFLVFRWFWCLLPSRGEGAWGCNNERRHQGQDVDVGHEGLPRPLPDGLGGALYPRHTRLHLRRSRLLY